MGIALKETMVDRLANQQAEIARLRADLDTVELGFAAVRHDNAKLRAALEAAQWGFNHVRCPVCAGWDGHTELDYVHNVDCIVAKALAKEGR